MMDTWVKIIILIVAAYILGSIPMSFLIAKSRGIDLRKQGSQQVGGSNVWRTTSRTLGVLVGIYDILKGAFMVYCAWLWGLDAGLQLFVGLGVIVGHNWPVFLKFHGGRGIATTLGIIVITPILNRGDITFWPLIGCAAVGIGSVIFFRRTPVPVLLALISMPIVSAAIKEPMLVSMGYAAILLIVVIKRLLAQSSTEKRQVSLGQLFLNRFLYDRDVRNRADWVHRKAADK
jgi:acyl phosphate:glycerol-3-phosphate acyltransferase